MHINIMSLLLFVCLLFPSSSFSQTRTQIPGTKVSVTLPSGYALAKNFIGVGNTTTGASVIVVQIPQPFSVAGVQIIDGMSDPENLSKMTAKGLEFKGKEDIVVGGKSGSLLHLTQTVQSQKFESYTLVVGDEAATFQLVGKIPTADKASANNDQTATLINILKSTEISAESAPIDLGFKVTPSEPLKQNGKLPPGALAFQVGEDPTPEGFLIISGSFRPVPAEAQNQFCKGRFTHEQRYEVKEEVKPKYFTVDALPACEITAVGSTKGSEGSTEPTKLYQLIIFGTERYFIASGEARGENGDKIIDAFKKTLESFKKTK